MGIVAWAPKTSNDVKSITNDADIVVRFLIVGSGSFSADVTIDNARSTRNSGIFDGSGHSTKRTKVAVAMATRVAMNSCAETGSLRIRGSRNNAATPIGLRVSLHALARTNPQHEREVGGNTAPSRATFPTIFVIDCLVLAL